MIKKKKEIGPAFCAAGHFHLLRHLRQEWLQAELASKTLDEISPSIEVEERAVIYCPALAELLLRCGGRIFEVIPVPSADDARGRRMQDFGENLNRWRAAVIETNCIVRARRRLIGLE